MMRPTLPLLAASLILAGCMLGPDYQRPATSLPASFNAEPAAAPGPAVARGWWKAFQDPALDALVAQALAHNSDVLIAAAKVEEADGLLREAAGAQWPEFDLTGAGTRTRASSVTATSQPSIPVFRNDFALRLGTAFELDFWGKLRRASEAARAQALGTRDGRDTVELTLVASLVRSYLELRGLDAQLAVSRETLASRDESARITRRRLTGGLASNLDVAQAEGALAATRAQIADLTRRRALAEHLLARLTGDLNLTLAPADLRSLPLPPQPPAGLPSTLLEARPDVRQAEAALVSANARIGVAVAERFPSISLTANLGRQSKELSDLFSSPARIGTLGLSLDLPIFDAGQRAARQDQATARQKQAQAAYIGTLRTAFTEVQDALAAATQRGEAEEALATQRDAADRALKLARSRYEAGYSPYLEVLDAQRSANDATLAFLTARQARLAAAVDLYAALGGGWSPSSTPETGPMN